MVEDDRVKILSREDLDALIRWAGPRPSERNFGDGGSDRDFVVFALAWVCGLHVQEIARLKVQSILALPARADAMLLTCKLWITGKSGKDRVIAVPAWLVLDLKAYIDGERKRSLDRRGPTVEEDRLILNSDLSARPGMPMSEVEMEDLMARACAGAGFLTEVETLNLATGGLGVALVPAYSMESLRHTFAVFTYHNYLRVGFSDMDAWAFIQFQMGYKSQKTTISTYRRHLPVWSSFSHCRVCSRNVVS